jgi:hypothetical protein
MRDSTHLVAVALLVGAAAPATVEEAALQATPASAGARAAGRAGARAAGLWAAVRHGQSLLRADEAAGADKGAGGAGGARGARLGVLAEERARVDVVGVLWDLQWLQGLRSCSGSKG